MHRTRESFVIFTSCCLITSTFTSWHDQMVFISFECDNIPPTWGKPVSTGWPGAQLIDNALLVTHLPLFKIIPSINLSISFLKQFVKVNDQFVGSICEVSHFEIRYIDCDTVGFLRYRAIAEMISTLGLSCIHSSYACFYYFIGRSGLN